MAFISADHQDTGAAQWIWLLVLAMVVVTHMQAVVPTTSVPHRAPRRIAAIKSGLDVATGNAERENVAKQECASGSALSPVGRAHCRIQA